MNLTHLDDNNRPKMVDVSDKNETKRVAIASGDITMSQDGNVNGSFSNWNKTDNTVYIENDAAWNNQQQYCFYDLAGQ